MRVENPSLHRSINRDQPECRPLPGASTFVVDALPEGPGGIHDCVAKYAKALGIVHIVCGLILMLTTTLLSPAVGPPDQVVGSDDHGGDLPSVFFLLSGSFAIQGARKRSRCLISASQTLSLFSAITAGLLLIKSWLMLGLFHPLIPSIMALLVGATMLIVATISAAIPSAIQAIQGIAPKVLESTSPTSYLAGIRANRFTFALSVVHLLWALLLILTDIVSYRHVGVKIERSGTLAAVTGFTLPPGILASVGIFLLASSLLALVSVKKSSKVLHISAMVPSVFAAVSAGIALYVCCVSAANQDYAQYDRLAEEYPSNPGNTQGFDFSTPFLMDLAIFGALVLLITTTATVILFINKIGTDSSPSNTHAENSDYYNYTQFLDSKIKTNQMFDLPS